MRHIYLTEGARKLRLDTEKRGVFERRLRILDLHTDRILFIHEAQWPQYKDRAEILGETLTHRIISKQILREVKEITDPDFDSSEFEKLSR